MHRGNDGQKDFQKTVGKVLYSCVVPVSTYGLETNEMDWTHGQNERRENTKKIRDKEARR